MSVEFLRVDVYFKNEEIGWVYFMVVSAAGQICFGIILEEYEEWPWLKKEFEYDIEYWWRVKHGWSREFSEENSVTYFEELKEFDQEYPLPAMLVSYNCGEFPLFMLAIPATSISASRANPEEFNPADLKINEIDLGKFIEFCDKYIVNAPQPKWYLSGYLG